MKQLLIVLDDTNGVAIQGKGLPTPIDVLELLALATNAVLADVRKTMPAEPKVVAASAGALRVLRPGG